MFELWNFEYELGEFSIIQNSWVSQVSELWNNEQHAFDELGELCYVEHELGKLGEVNFEIQ